MKKIIIFFMMALLFAGAADAKTPRKTKSKKATTTRTTSKRQAPTPISEPILQININQLDRNHREDYEAFLNGTASAQELCNIAENYYYGFYGFPENKAEALRWYYLAAKAGSGDACCAVGRAYDEPDEFDYAVKKNYFEAAKWYAKASALECKENDPDFNLAVLLKYHCITNDEFRIANEFAGNDVQEARDAANASYNEFHANQAADSQRQPFSGTWTSARGSTFTISKGPYLDVSGAGRYKGEWKSDGSLYVNLGYPYSITLRYYNGYLYDTEGRMHWRIGD